MNRNSHSRSGSTLVVTISVVATLLVLLAVAVEYTSQISRNTQRSRKTAMAVEIADGHLEALFSNWRNIYRTSWVTWFGSNTGGTDYSVVGTNFFATAMYTPSPTATPIVTMVPQATPPIIALPSPSHFASNGTYTVTQYRIQAVDPMVNLDANENALAESGTSKGNSTLAPLPPDVAPPAAFGPNRGPSPKYDEYYFPYSFYYLASVDVEVPAQTGVVKAKVRRVFEKKFDLPWSYALFYVDDLELQPTDTMVINGPIHTNGSLFIGTSNFTVASPAYAAPTPFPTSGKVEYGTDYVNGFAPKDPRSGNGTVPSVPNFAKSDASLALSDCPPSQVSPYLPFGWNLTLSASNGSQNDDSYREIVEMPQSSGSGTDNLQSVRYYNQAMMKITIDKDNNVRIWRPDMTAEDLARNPAKNVECTASSASGSYERKLYDLIVTNKALTTNLAMQDAKENVNVRIAELDISKIQAAIDGGTLTKSQYSPWVIYIADTTSAYDSSGTRNMVNNPQARLGSTNGTTGGTLVTTAERAIRLVNGYKLPAAGLTIVSPNPIYIKGNYNTGGTSTGNSPPSNTTVTSSPVVGSYARPPSAIVGDAINVLSANWNDANSTQSIGGGGYSATGPRSAVSTTINTALVSGNIPSGTYSYGATSNIYGGGGEGFIRLQEDWRTQNFVYYGSMVQLFRSVQANSAGSPGGQFFKAPANTRWFYDYATFSDSSPPGDLVIAAYLQQQRWYQVY